MGRGEDAPDHVNSTPLLCHHRMLYIDMKFLMALKNVLLLVCMSNLVLSLFP